MLRDIATDYNVWNIDEAEYQKIADAIPGQNQELAESTEITAPKADLGISKKFVIRYRTVFWRQPTSTCDSQKRMIWFQLILSASIPP